MMRFIRNALATICFAASVGCLGLWGWSLTHIAALQGRADPLGCAFQVTTIGGITTVNVTESNIRSDWKFASIRLGPQSGMMIREPDEGVRRFGIIGRAVYFPGWYPALIFVLAGVGVLRFRRQFSIGTALICVSIVALMLGMVVAL